MTPLVLGLVCGIGAFIIGIAVMTAIQRSSAKSKAKTIIEEAQKEAYMLMQEKLLRAREEELHIKAEADKAANQRMAKVQQNEARLKQR